VIEAVQKVLRYKGHTAELEPQPNMSTGPLNRVTDHFLAVRLLGWKPTMKFFDGLQRTIDWYLKTKNREQVAVLLDQLLTERKIEKPTKAKVVSTVADYC